MNRAIKNILGRKNRLTSTYITVILISVSVFLIGFTMTSIFAKAVSDQNRADYTAELSQESVALRMRLTERMSSYNQLLYAASSQFSIKPDLSREDWRQFYEDMRVHENNPAIVGIGYAPYILSDTIQSFEESLRSEGYADFKVEGLASGDDHVIIQYIEPFEGSNLVALGGDMYAERARRDAMISASASTQAKLSRPAFLLQDSPTETDTNKIYGALMYLPVYNSKTPPPTAEARKADLRGFVYIAFRPGDIMERASESTPGLSDGVNISLKSLSSGTGQTLYEVKYANPKSNQLVTIVKDVSFFGQTWRLSISGQDRAINQFYGPISLFFLGAGFSSFIALTVYFILASRIGKVQQLFEEDVENTKSELLALASHQLRTPATGVKQYLGILRDGIVGDLTPNQQDMVEKAYQTNERQLHVINDLLYVSKVEAGQLAIDPVPTDVTRITKDIINNLASRAKEKNIKVVFTVRKACMITADDRYVGMIIENLISNAIKYSYDSTTVRITLKQTDGAMVMKVVDNGVGISEENIQRAFDKFNRIENPLSRQEGGSGLGLFLANQLARGHGGMIEVEKKKNKSPGTIFVLTLPVVAMIDHEIVTLASTKKRQPRTRPD